MAQFKYTGKTNRVFIDFVDETAGHVLEAVPGETYEILACPDDALFEAVAKNMKATAQADPAIDPSK
jgi:hypothetical protein